MSYALVSEQKKGLYKYFMDLGDRLEVVEPKTLYVDEVRTFFVRAHSELILGLE